MLRLLNASITRPHEVVVIYDDPDDPSAEIVRDMMKEAPNVRAVLNSLGRGVAYAIRTGVSSARGERVLIFAADEVGPVLAIEDMLELMDLGVEFVSCTRYAHGGRRLGGSLIGHLLSRSANRLLRLLSGVALTDSTTGIKMFRRRDFDRLTQDTKSVGWAIAFEMAVRAQLLALKLGEVPIISIDRLFGGKSTFRLIPWIVGYLDYFILAIRTLPRRQRPQVTLRIPTGMS